MCQGEIQVSFEQLLRKFQREVEEGRTGTNEEDLELLPLFVNPDNELIQVPEGAVEHLKTIRQINNTLSKFNLSKNEIKVYLYLARFGHQKAIVVAESLDIHRTETYKILNQLESQGLVSRILERPLQFVAIPLEKALENFIEERRQQVSQLEKKKEDLLNSWKSIPVSDSIKVEKQTFQVIEAKNHIGIKINEMIGNCKERFDIVVKEQDIAWIYNTTIFRKLEKDIQKRGIQVRLLTNYSPENGYLPEGIRIKGAQMGYLTNWQLPSFFISDQKEMVQLLNEGEDDVSALWTDYKSIIKSHRMLTNLLWQTM